MKTPALLKSELRVAHANLDQLRAELYLAELQNKRLLARLQEVNNDRKDAKAKLKTVEQERDDTKARLKTVEKERDDANERVRLSIAEWYRLERLPMGRLIWGASERFLLYYFSIKTISRLKCSIYARGEHVYLLKNDI